MKGFSAQYTRGYIFELLEWLGASNKGPFKLVGKQELPTKTGVSKKDQEVGVAQHQRQCGKSRMLLSHFYDFGHIPIYFFFYAWSCFNTFNGVIVGSVNRITVTERIKAPFLV